MEILKQYLIEKFCEEISLQTEVQNVILANYGCFDWEKHENDMVKLMSLEHPFEGFMRLAEELKEDECNMKMLTLQLECARRCFAHYQRKGIGKNIYLDTMSCFTRFLGEYYQKHGRYGFDCPWWTYRQLNMSLFRLGPLEFEYETSEENGKTINIHIPSDSSIKEEVIEDGIMRCKEFTKNFYPEFVGTKFACHSWLLSPKLLPILSEKSNIMRFQKMFTIKRVYEDEDQFFGYIFGVCSDTPIDELKEETSLQRGVKELLKQSVKIGGAYGEHIEKW